MRETPIGDRLQDRPVARRPRVRTHPVGFPARMGMRQTPGFLRVSTHSTHVLQTFHRAWTKNPQEKLLWKKIRSMRSEPYKCWGFGRYLSVLFARGCVLPAAHPRHVSSRAGRRAGAGSAAPRAAHLRVPPAIQGSPSCAHARRPQRGRDSRLGLDQLRRRTGLSPAGDAHNHQSSQPRQ